MMQGNGNQEQEQIFQWQQQSQLRLQISNFDNNTQIALLMRGLIINQNDITRDDTLDMSERYQQGIQDIKNVNLPIEKKLDKIIEELLKMKNQLNIFKESTEKRLNDQQNTLNDQQNTLNSINDYITKQETQNFKIKEQLNQVKDILKSPINLKKDSLNVMDQEKAIDDAIQHKYQSKLPVIDSIINKPLQPNKQDQQQPINRSGINIQQKQENQEKKMIKRQPPTFKLIEKPPLSLEQTTLQSQIWFKAFIKYNQDFREFNFKIQNLIIPVDVAIKSYSIFVKLRRRNLLQDLKNQDVLLVIVYILSQGLLRQFLSQQIDQSMGQNIKKKVISAIDNKPWNFMNFLNCLGQDLGFRQIYNDSELATSITQVAIASLGIDLKHLFKQSHKNKSLTFFVSILIVGIKKHRKYYNDVAGLLDRAIKYLKLQFYQIQMVEDEINKKIKIFIKKANFTLRKKSNN